MAEFEVFVSKADFKFNCAHFIIFDGFRERLHGHNYQVSVKVTGGGHLGADGYLIDFGDIKKAARSLCSSLNEYFICPLKSPNMEVIEEGEQLCLNCDDGSRFVFPKGDCAMLPIAHSSAEEMSHYFWCSILRKIGLQKMLARGIKTMEISVAEAHNQLAVYRCPIPSDEAGLVAIESAPWPKTARPCLRDD